MPHPLFPRVVVHFAKYGPGDYEVFGTVKADYHTRWRTWTRGKWTDIKKAREMADRIGRDLEERFHSPRPYELVHGAPPDHVRRVTGRKRRKTGRKARRTGRK
jgi:hypothetical protein